MAKFSPYIISLSVFAVSGAALLAQGATTGPKARYAMDIGTMTGFSAMGGGMRGGMGMMFGGGADREAHEVHLRLGSTLSPNGGAPKADHFLLPAAKMGKSVPLTTPDRPQGESPDDFERPKGRLILFWGCGAHAPKGQPVIIDFAKVAAGQIPPGLFSTRVPVDRGPSVTNSRTFGDWPRKGGKQPAQGSSLLGEHRVLGNYSPDMKFTLTQDYMPGITGRSAPNPAGGTNLSWNGVPGATGYLAWAMGFKTEGRGDPNDFVWWTSSAAKEFGGGLWDWLPPATVARLVNEKVIMPTSQTSCTIPAEVKTYAPDMTMGTLYAYGPEANFAYPPRPDKGTWNIDWTAKVRYRSMTSWMINGPSMMGGEGEAAQGEQRQPPPRKCKPSVFGVLTGSGC
jgi:hypothetical protein